MIQSPSVSLALLTLYVQAHCVINLQESTPTDLVQCVSWVKADLQVVKEAEEVRQDIPVKVVEAEDPHKDAEEEESSLQHKSRHSEENVKNSKSTCIHSAIFAKQIWQDGTLSHS